MGSHPINLAFRFILELAALASFGYWGWIQADGWMRFLLALGIPILLAVVWGIFAVPNDPSRSGAAPIKTAGFIRLLLELSFFVFATWCLKELDLSRTSMIFGSLVILHYLISYDRIHWLIKQ